MNYDQLGPPSECEEMILNRWTKLVIKGVLSGLIQILEDKMHGLKGLSFFFLKKKCSKQKPALHLQFKHYALTRDRIRNSKMSNTRTVWLRQEKVTFFSQRLVSQKQKDGTKAQVTMLHYTISIYNDPVALCLGFFFIDS